VRDTAKRALAAAQRIQVEASAILTETPGHEIPTLCMGPFWATTCGLQILGDASLEECAEYLSGLVLVERTVHWLIGDLLLEMEARFGEDYAQAVYVTGFSEQTLRNDVWVCKSIPASRRRESVPFGVHAEVAALPPEEQTRLLDTAERNDYSCREMRAARMMTQDPEEEAVNARVLVGEIRSRLEVLLEMMETPSLRQALRTIASMLADFAESLKEE